MYQLGVVSEPFPQWCLVRRWGFKFSSLIQTTPFMEENVITSKMNYPTKMVIYTGAQKFDFFF